jgi:hypothetical protein
MNSGYGAEIEARIASRDFADITKVDLPTPCLIPDQAVFEQNLRTMADRCGARA